jgi:hypothetical protein
MRDNYFYYAYLGPITIAEGGADFVYEQALEYCHRYSYNIQQVVFMKDNLSGYDPAVEVPLDTMRKMVYKNDH